MNKIVHIKLFKYRNGDNLITSKQSDFRPILSTELALTQFTDSVLVPRRSILGPLLFVVNVMDLPLLMQFAK